MDDSTSAVVCNVLHQPRCHLAAITPGSDNSVPDPDVPKTESGRCSDRSQNMHRRYFASSTFRIPSLHQRDAPEVAMFDARSM